MTEFMQPQHFPLYVDKLDGTRTQVGTALVSEDEQGFSIEPTLTSELAKELEYGRGPFSLGIDEKTMQIVEVVVVAVPATPKETDG